MAVQFSKLMPHSFPLRISITFFLRFLREANWPVVLIRISSVLGMGRKEVLRLTVVYNLLLSKNPNLTVPGDYAVADFATCYRNLLASLGVNLEYLR